METAISSSGEIIKKIYFNEKRFGFEPEVTSKISRFKGIRIYEVGFPIMEELTKKVRKSG